MVSRAVAETVIDIINNKGEQLEKLTERFKQEIDRQDQILALSNLTTLLIDGILDPPSQVIVIWLLQTAFPDLESDDNPFLPIYHILLETNSSKVNSSAMRLWEMITYILTVKDIESLSSKSADDILQPNFSFDLGDSQDLSQSSSLSFQRLSPIVVSQKEPNITDILSKNQLLTELLVDPVAWKGFVPPCIRVAPERLKISTDELLLSTIVSIDSASYIYDDSTSLNEKAAAALLMSKVTESTLTPHDEDFLLRQIELHPSVIDDYVKGRKDNKPLRTNNCRIDAVYMTRLSEEVPSILDPLASADIDERSISVFDYLMTKNPERGEVVFDRFLLNGIDSVLKTRDNRTKKTKTKILANLVAKLYENGYNFSSQAEINLHSLWTDFKKKGIEEINVLDDMMTS